MLVSPFLPPRVIFYLTRSEVRVCFTSAPQYQQTVCQRLLSFSKGIKLIDIKQNIFLFALVVKAEKFHDFFFGGKVRNF